MTSIGAANAVVKSGRPPALRLLAVLAHPDDESLGMGGVLARYAQEGIEVFLVTATRGDGGRYRGLPRGAEGHPGGDALAALRQAELQAAASALGVREVALLDYADGQLDRVDPREAIARLVVHLRRIRPHVVVTFGPDGVYGHPDHVAISQLATAAVVAAGDPERADPGIDADPPPHAASKLYYLVMREPALAAYEAAVRRLSTTVDGEERRAAPWPDWAVTTVVDTRDAMPRVRQAIACHASQVAAYGALDALPPEQHEALWGWPSFYRAFSTVNGGRERETDLFAGLR